MLFEPDQEVDLRMDWALICRIACAAMIRRMTLDEFVTVALKDKLTRMGKWS